MAITAATQTLSTPRSAATTRGRRFHGWFALAVLAGTAVVLVALFQLVGARTAPSAYPGLNGFPKTGTVPSKTDGDVVTFVFAFLVGFLIQRSRWCNASAIRDAILFKSFRNTKPLLAAMMIITGMFTIFEAINVGQPINIVGGAFTVLGLFLFGIGMVLGGSCTVSVWIRSAEGSFAAMWALLYTFIGMFLFSELWNVLRWPAANYLQTTSANWSILSFGSFNAMTLRGAFGPVLGPVAVLLAGAAQVGVLIVIYRRLLRIERVAAAARAVRPGPAAAVAAGSAVPAGPTAGVPAPAPPRQATRPAAGLSSGQLVELPNGGTVQVDRVLDCSGEMCPRPQLFTKRAVVKDMSVGQVLELVVDNPSSPELVPTIMNDIGAVHLQTVRGEHDWKLYIRKERETTAKGARR